MNIEQMGQLLNIQVTDQPEEDVVDMLDRNRDRVVEGNIIRGSVKSHKLNASIILENDSRMATRFRYNEFNDQIYINGENYEDEDTTEIELWLHRVYSVQIAKEKVNDLIIRQAKNNSFHPLQDYLNSLEWDGVCRLETLLQT
jgi:predicted P-loop ATPase